MSSQEDKGNEPVCTTLLNFFLLMLSGAETGKQMQWSF